MLKFVPNFFKYIKNVFENISNILFPPVCGICGKLGESICEKCYKNLKKFEIKKQHKDLFFVYRYEGIIRELLIKYKFGDRPYLYKLFSESLIKNKKVCNFLKSYDIIFAVPLHKKRQRERGYNQAEIIANELAKSLNKSYGINQKILMKTKILNLKVLKEKRTDLKVF